ncbi:MAG: hypothetical protein JXA20_18290, partial [Spirochaetes bacterium]|nr:hypothetical protein [Spirochaetota bacterium]
MRFPAAIIAAALAASWELPQSLLGLLFYLSQKRRGWVIAVERHRGRLMVQTPAAGISLGLFVFWCGESAHPAFVLDDRNRLHEFGHAVQSRYLGPLY